MDFHFSVGAFTFGVIDIAIVALLLIAFIIGLCKGFLKRFLGLIKLGAAGAGAFFLEPVCSEWFIGIKDKVILKCIEICNGFGEVMTTTLPSDPTVKQQALEAGINNLKVPAILRNKIVEIAMNSSEPTVGQALGTELGGFAYRALVIVAAFLILFIVISILFKLLFGKMLKGKSAAGGLDRLLGGIVNLAICAAVICLVFFGLQALASFEALSSVTGWIETNIGIGDDTIKSLAKWLYESNPFLLLIGTK